MNLIAKPKILIISISNLKTDPRVYRQINFLQKDSSYQITTAGLKDPEIENVDFFPIISQPKSFIGIRAIKAGMLKIKKFEQYYWSSPVIQNIYQKLSSQQFDLIIANDLNTLLLALRLAENSKAKVLLDAHEYEPRHFDDRWFFRFFFQEYWDYICRQYLPKVDAMITVCPGIAEEYSRNYGVKCDVLTNAPFYESLSPSKIDNNCIRMIYHGGINKSRKIENMILLMDLLDERFTLDFMLVADDKKYLNKLKKLASNQHKIKFRDPVPMPEISKTINDYDIGLFLLSPAAFNYRMALPNKLFEYIQGRLAVAIWPSPEMARILKEYNCGLVSDNFTIESMAKNLNNLSTEDIQRFKQNSHQAASTLCAETNRQILLKKVQELIG